MTRSIYVASPLGFSTVGKLYYQQVLLPAIRAADLKVLDPWAPRHAREAGMVDAMKLTEGEERRQRLAVVNNAMAKRNHELIERADGVLAVLDGSDVDSGTAAEIGAASVLGKPIVGLRTDFRSLGDNEGSPVNLQVEYFISRTGGEIVADAKRAARLLARLIARQEKQRSPRPAAST